MLCCEKCESCYARDVQWRVAPSPGLDDTAVADSDFANPGHLAMCASAVPIKCLYGAGRGRWDSLFSIAHLASGITCWTVECDERLLRLMRWIRCSFKMRVRGGVGGPPRDLALTMFADADQNGCKITRESASGILLALAGPTTWLPLSGSVTKQKSQSHSAPESAPIAMDKGIEELVIPGLELWEVPLQTEVSVTLEEDNEATIKILQKGYSPKLRHLPGV
jgi:hypothetical protein